MLFQQFLHGNFMVQKVKTELFNVSFTIEGEAIVAELAWCWFKDIKLT